MNTFNMIAKKAKTFITTPNGGRRPPHEAHRRLFSPLENGWLKAVHSWVENPGKRSASPDTYPILQQVLKGLDPFYREVAELHLNCGRLAVNAKTLLTVSSTKFNQRAKDTLAAAWNVFEPETNCPPELTNSAKQITKTWLSGSVNAMKITYDALRHAESFVNPKPSSPAWHLRSTGYLRDFVRTLLGKQEGGHSVHVHFVFMRQNNEQGREGLAELVFEVIPGGDGHIFLSPEQAFVNLEDGFDALFNNVPRAVRCLIGDADPDNKSDVRVNINCLDTKKMLDVAVLKGESATGAAGRGLYYALTGKVPDPGVFVLAALDTNGKLGPVDHVKQKVKAIAKSECVDTIIVADENNEEQAKEALRECGKLDEISLVNITPPTLEQLVKERAKLVSEVLTYLDALAENIARLSPDYPAHLCSAKSGTTGFDKLRRTVQVVEYRGAYGPSPVPWDEHAGEQFGRAVVLGNPGFGKTWLLIYEALCLARIAATKLRERTIGLDEVVLPIFTRISDVSLTHVPFEQTLAELAGRSLSQKFRCFVQRKFKTDRCVILLDGWEEAQQDLRRRIVNFARHFPNPRILLTSRIAGYNFGHPPVLDAQELKLLDFDQEQIESFIRVWYEGDTQTCKDFLEMLALHDDLRCAARILGLLTAMCLKGRDRRVELYEKFVNYMLQNVPSPPVDLIQLLQKLALNHLNSVDQQFSRAFLQATITAWVKPLGSSAPNIAELEKLIIRTGVIRADKGHGDLWSFSLPAFRDYLAARELAEQIRSSGASGLEQILVLPTGRVTVQRLVDEKADDPTWKAVLAFLAGQLPVDKALLLAKQLGSPGCVNRTHSTLVKKEDRLLLVAQCLNEINIRE